MTSTNESVYFNFINGNLSDFLYSIATMSKCQIFQFLAWVADFGAGKFFTVLQYIEKHADELDIFPAERILE